MVYPSATFKPGPMAKALTLHACTHACLVPTALHSLIDHAERENLTFPALKDVCLAGASITPQHLRQVVTKLGSRGVSTGFGMTEGSPVWVAPTPDPEMLIAGDDTISGSASPGASIKICASDSALPLPRGQPGEIHESGPGVIAGYLGDDVGTENFYFSGGRSWFKTGDRAVMHTDGRVSIVGRYKDMIIRGGENIYSSEVENVLYAHPAVTDCALIGVPHRTLGEEPVAVVHLAPGKTATEAELQQWVKARLAIFKTPVAIRFVPETLPRNANGKILKKDLKTLFADRIDVAA